MGKSKAKFLFVIVICIVILLILANIEIFTKMNKLQSTLLLSLEPLKEIKETQNELLSNLKPLKSIEKSQNEMLTIFEPFKNMGEMGMSESLEAGVNAPEFTLFDTKGQMISLNDFTGKKILLEFSSVNCPPCKRIYSTLKKFNEENKDIQLIMICDGYIEELLQLESKEGLNFPILMWNNSVVNDYLAYSTPYFYLIDGEGKIINKGSANTLEQLEEIAQIEK